MLLHKKTNALESFGTQGFQRYFLELFSYEDSLAVPFKKAKKRKNHVFLRGACFGYPLFLCEKQSKPIVFPGFCVYTDKTKN